MTVMLLFNIRSVIKHSETKNRKPVKDRPLLIIIINNNLICIAPVCAKKNSVYFLGVWNVCR